jgi:glycosyltransferase involved in cell wall biosynthesis
MATYNGGKHLVDQIESLLAQSCKDWTLFVHDDGSTDNTLSILENYSGKYPDKIIVFDYPSQGGSCKNFLSIMQHTDANYYMFCDQDDVWLQEKIELTFKAMQEQEKQNKGKAIVVCSDMFITDTNLKIIHPSRNTYSYLHPQYIRVFDDCAPTAGVTGCTMMFNRKAKGCCVFPVQKYAFHDNWITICTLRSGGILHYIDQPLMYYRQHDNNTLGAGIHSASSVDFKYRITHLSTIIRRHYEQYMLLRSLGYGSVVKYISHTLDYKRRLKTIKY